MKSRAFVPQRALSRAAAAAIDSLECRVLLSATIHHRTLTVTGTNANDVITADTDGTTTTVQVNNLPPVTFADSAYDRIDVDARDGDDSVSMGINITKPATIRGGDGNDNLTGGGGNDVLIAGLGNDTLAGGGTTDTPGGVNTADYSDRHEALTVSGGQLTTAAGETDTLGTNLQRLLTGSGNDSIGIGANYRGDTLYIDAGGGDDNISLTAGGYASGGTVHGGAGNDHILMNTHGIAEYFGDAGDDTFDVYRDSYTTRIFHGGPGVDTANYGSAVGGYGVWVTLDGQQNDGSPVEYGRQSDYDDVDSDIERVVGQYNGNRIIGSPRADILVGGANGDFLLGLGGRDSLDGGAGADLLIAEGNPATLVGGLGEDTLVALGAHDHVVSDANDIVITQRLTLANGLLFIAGDDSSNRISIVENPLDATQVIANVDGVSHIYAKSAVQRIVVLGEGDNDFIQLDGRLNDDSVSVFGNDGNDTITGSDLPDQYYYLMNFFGGAGDDLLSGGTGRNYLFGGTGNDTISLRNAEVNEALGEIGTDTITGPDIPYYQQIGINIIDGGRGNDFIHADGYLYGGPDDDTILGADGADTFYQTYGGGWNDVPALWASRGNDSIDGGGGGDSIREYLGHDTLNGGDGNDTITAGDDPMTVNGGAGDDSLTGFAGDVIHGSTGDDTIHSYGAIAYGDENNDTLLGGFGSDTLIGGPGDDLLNQQYFYGDSTGADSLDGGDGNDTIYGQGGNDTIFAGDGNDLLYGGPGNDYIDCGPGDDSAYGEDGDDTLIGGPGNDLLDGGSGNNVIVPEVVVGSRAGHARGITGSLIDMRRQSQT